MQAAKDAKASELAADDSAVEASTSAQSAGESASAAATSESNAAKSAGDAANSASDAKAAAGKAVEDASELLKTYTDNAKTSADNAATSASSAADAASAASGSASAAEQSATDASNAKVAAQTATAEAETAKAAAATSASNAATSADAAAKSASDAAASVGEMLTEAKKYTDANTSNALVGTVSGKLLHVEDAWPGKPLGLTIEGAYKQDGTPSPENPVPITVIENPVLRVTGKNLWNKGIVVYNYSVDYLRYNPAAAVMLTAGTYTISSDGRLPNLQFFEPGSHKQLTCAEATDMDGANIRYSIVWNGYGISPVNDNARVLTITLTRAVEMTGCVVNAQGTWIQIEYGTKATAYKPYVSTSIPITLPAEHPYLVALPDGTHDEIVIDKDGNASLVARVKATTTDDINAALNYEEKAGGADFQVYLGLQFKYGINLVVSNVCIGGNVNKDEPANGGIIKGGYVRMTKPEKVTDIASARAYLIEIGFVAYIATVTPVTYQLGKLDIPSLPETISNVWTDAELTTNMSMTYKRDINIAFGNLVQAVVAAAACE